ncbi:MAG: transposase family protein [Acholeplasmataceae bacterium]|nr:transposase family protein [Acholeplasmataceae bacterium]
MIGYTLNEDDYIYIKNLQGDIIAITDAEGITLVKYIAIEEILTAFGIRRSLSNPRCPYDNAVAKVLYKIIKTEFV